MDNFKIKNPPEYSEILQMLKSTDPNHADTFNVLFEQLINNDAFLKKILEKLKETATEHIEDDDLHVTAQDKQGWDAKAETDTVTQSAPGLMSAEDKKKLDGIAALANNYSHPAHTARTSGLYKVTVDGAGHVASVAAVTKTDITALGIPAQDTNTTYPNASASAAGLVSTGAQTFAGAKTFSGAVAMNSTVRAANNGRMVSVQSSAPSDTGMLWAW